MVIKEMQEKQEKLFLEDFESNIENIKKDLIDLREITFEFDGAVNHPSVQESIIKLRTKIAETHKKVDKLTWFKDRMVDIINSDEESSTELTSQSMSRGKNTKIKEISIQVDDRKTNIKVDFA